MTYQQCLKEGSRQLRSAGIQSCDTDAWILMESVTGMTRTQYLMRMNEEIPEDKLRAFRKVTAERALRKPVQHITGCQEFMGLSFQVNEHVLIPRQDTELLVEETIKHLKDGMSFLDLCTGSGCILISVLKLCKMEHVTGMGSDISSEALRTARYNLEKNGIRASLKKSDLFESIEGEFDLIVSNPPYIATKEIETLEPEVRKYDPVLALDGKEDGLFFYRGIVKEAGKYLRRGGHLLFEIGYDQGRSVPALLEAAGYTEIQVKKDLAGLDRVVIAMYNNSEK